MGDIEETKVPTQPAANQNPAPVNQTGGFAAPPPATAQNSAPLLVPRPRKTTNKTIFWIFLAVCLLVIVAAGYLFYSGSKTPGPQAKNPAVVPPPQNGDATKALAPLAGLSKIDTSTTAVTGAAKLPADLNFLVMKGAQNVDVKQASFTSGKSGYNVVYSVPQDLRSLFKTFFNLSAPWTVPTKLFSGNASVTEMENSSYQIKVQMYAQQASTTAVGVQVIKK